MKFLLTILIVLSVPLIVMVLIRSFIVFSWHHDKLENIVDSLSTMESIVLENKGNVLSSMENIVTIVATRSNIEAIALQNKENISTSLQKIVTIVNTLSTIQSY